MRRKSKSAAGTLAGSAEAKRCAHAVLEVLSGLKGPSEAAQALSVSLPRYYVLETRALEGMVRSLEPREKGKRGASAETALDETRKERDRLQVELRRMRSLVRVAQRTVGLPGVSERKEGKEDPGKGRRGKRKVNRTRRVLSRLGGECGKGKERRAEGPREEASGGGARAPAEPAAPRASGPAG